MLGLIEFLVDLYQWFTMPLKGWLITGAMLGVITFAIWLGSVSNQ